MFTLWMIVLSLAVMAFIGFNLVLGSVDTFTTCIGLALVFGCPLVMGALLKQIYMESSRFQKHLPIFWSGMRKQFTLKSLGALALSIFLWLMVRYFLEAPTELPLWKNLAAIACSYFSVKTFDIWERATN